MSNIKVGDKVGVISTGIFGHLVEIGDVGTVTEIDGGYEVEVLFNICGIELYQYVYYDDWNEYLSIVKE
ncbi:hypothetical protein ACT414_18820 (plasmid) [Acinetobacter baumannii]